MSLVEKQLSPLFQPLTIRGLVVKNRFFMSPMTRGKSPGGIPGRDVAAYYARRAKGGVGAIVTEAIAIDHPAAIAETHLNEKDLPVIFTEAAINGWRGVVEAVHAAGGTIIPQFWHQGPMKMPDMPPQPDVEAFSPSGYYGPKEKASEQYREVVELLARPLPVPSDKEIVEVVESFGRAAAIAHAIGFDGIAIHGAHGYLIDAFLWGETNRRTDRWGGNIGARTLFATAVVQAIRKEIGAEKPIIFRFSQWKQQDFKARLAETPAELEAVLGPIADAGADVFDASARYFNTPAFEGSDLSLAGWAKKVTGKLSGIVGGVGMSRGMYDTINAGAAASSNLDLLLARFERGEFDIVSVGRAILHDPFWVDKARCGEPFLPFDPASLSVLT